MKNIIILFGTIGILAHHANAQALKPKEPTPLEVGSLKLFPATKILNVIESIQADLKNCEQTNNKIITNERRTNQTLTIKLSETQTLLNRAENRADSLSHTVSNIHTVSVSAKRDITKLKWFKYVDRAITIIIPAITTYYLTKKP